MAAPRKSQPRTTASAAKTRPPGTERHLEQHTDSRVAQMLAGIRAAGLKLTPQRVAIVQTLADDPTHPTAQELFDRLRAAMPTMSFATVYNTLAALTSAGLVGSLSLAPGAARFDPNRAQHDHAVCDGCGLVRDVMRQEPEAPGRAERQAGIAGFFVHAVEHIYRGLCATCASSR